MGTETPTNFPFCSAGPVLGTKFPSKIPMAMERKIHNARKRSSQPSPLNAGTLDAFEGWRDTWVSRSNSGELWGGEDDPLVSLEVSRFAMVMGGASYFLSFSSKLLKQFVDFVDC